MNDLNVRRWVGAFGVASFVVFLFAIPLYCNGIVWPKVQKLSIT